MNRNYILAGVAALVIAGIGLAAYLHHASIPVLQPQGPVAAGELRVLQQVDHLGPAAIPLAPPASRSSGLHSPGCCE